MLRVNQKIAIEKSIENDFTSGIHYHATGSGKSWIAMKIVEEFNASVRGDGGFGSTGP